MMNEQNKPVNLSVHETSDPTMLSADIDSKSSGSLNDLKDANHDDENVDVPNPNLFDEPSDENLMDRQNTIANLSAG